jgi:hypothetical protein
MTPEKIAETAKRIRERIFDRVQDEGAFHASSIERVISDELRLAMVANVPAAVGHRESIDLHVSGVSWTVPSDWKPCTDIVNRLANQPADDIFSLDYLDSLMTVTESGPIDSIYVKPKK